MSRDSKDPGTCNPGFLWSMKRSTESALATEMLLWGAGMVVTAVMGTLLSSASKVRRSLPLKRTTG